MKQASEPLFEQLWEVQGLPQLRRQRRRTKDVSLEHSLQGVRARKGAAEGCADVGCVLRWGGLEHDCVFQGRSQGRS